MELYVCAFVKDRLPSWRIAQILGIDPGTVDNHRSNARAKMKIRGGKPLNHYLTMI
jgi:DNA-binding CsgD family transcriptional regulator